MSRHAGSAQREAPEAAPVDVEPLLEAGLARRAAGDLAGAEASFREALGHDPDNASALYILGLTRFEAGDAPEAERLFEHLVAVRPDHAEAQFTLASLRHWRDERPAAIACYQRAIEIDPNHAGAHTGLARALVESGDHSAGLEAACAALALVPEAPSAHLALGSAWRGLGEVREAAVAFSEAARLDPNLVAAHIGAALAYADLGEALQAAIAAERAVTLDPQLCDGWQALGVAMRGLHQPEHARLAFERAVALDPTRATAELNLGLALIELERAQDARRHLERALELDPASAKAHANLSSLYILAGRRDLAKAHAQRALDIDPNMMSAHQNLAALLAEDQDAVGAQLHRDAAYAERNLVITTAESGNTPDRYLIPPRDYTRLLWFIEYGNEAQMTDLPAYDVAFNAIGDEDLAGPTTANAHRFTELCATSLINPPQLIARTRRDLTGELLGAIPGLVVPRTTRIEAADLGPGGVREAAAAAGIETPFLVRPIGSHGGKGLQLVGGEAPDEALTPARAYYLTQFVDFRSADGLYRKYRTIFVDGAALPYHLAISPNWMVHYESSGMEQHPDRLAEEMVFLDDPAAALGAEAAAAVEAVGRAMGLGYAGVDFTLLPDGRVLVFEANATMLAHPEAPDGPLAHKNPSIERIFAAFRAMLARED
jgi:tetratricopeptide (TPR) repeat protein